MIIPTNIELIVLLDLIIIGLGCVPIYPSIIHSTPENFGVENSQAIIGVEMASAYTGFTLAPPILGFLTNFISISIYPLFLLIFAVLMLDMT